MKRIEIAKIDKETYKIIIKYTTGNAYDCIMIKTQDYILLNNTINEILSRFIETTSKYD